MLPRLWLGWVVIGADDRAEDRGLEAMNPGPYCLVAGGLMITSIVCLLPLQLGM